LPTLLTLVGHGGHLDDPWGSTTAVIQTVHRAVLALGDGPYGVAAQHLFGFSNAARGLTLPRRRGLAAEALDVQVSTVIRWWQHRILEDVATSILGNRAGFDESCR
jgi:hypothetical protein